MAGKTSALWVAFSYWLYQRSHPKILGLTTAGYVLNTAVVPLLALAGRWEVAAGLMIAKRTGKAIRTPPREVLLLGKCQFCPRPSFTATG